MTAFFGILLFGLPVAAFVAGLTRLPPWLGVVCPLVEVIVWGILRLGVSAEFDMKHALVELGLILAVACVGFWLGGRAIAMWARSASRKPR